MPEVGNPTAELGAIVLTLPASAVGAKRASGVVDPLVTWNAVSGDVAITPPVGTAGGGGTRALSLNGVVVVTAATVTVLQPATFGGAAVNTPLITHAANGTFHHAVKNAAGVLVFGWYLSGGGLDLALYDIASGGAAIVVAGTTRVVGIPAALVVGTDPGGASVLRVGGAARFAGAVQIDGGQLDVIATGSNAALYLTRVGATQWRQLSDASGVWSLTDVTHGATVLTVSPTTGHVAFLGNVVLAAGFVDAQAFKLGTWTAAKFVGSALVLGGDAAQFSSMIVQALGVQLASFAAGAIVLGTDPGGTELLRVGGSLKASLFTSASGTVSAPSATPTTLFSIPSTGLWRVHAWYNNVGYQCSALISMNTASFALLHHVSENPGGFFIDLSGANVRINHTLGSAATVNFSYMRIG